MMKFPAFWDERMKEMAKAILERNSASSFECFLKEIPYAPRPGGGDFQKEKDLVKILNTLIEKGALRACVMLTTHAHAYILFHNPRRFRL